MKPTWVVLGAYLLLLILCGCYDVARNRKLDRSVLQRYFLGNGLWTWALSPFNTLVDLLSLPYVNKGIYRLDDLPGPYRDEIQRLIDAAQREGLVAKLERMVQENPRTMIFFRWYGAPVRNRVDIPAFHQKFRYIKTIGVSVFNKKQSTSRHFGPLRVTLRVLYNLNDMDGPSAYIEVGDVVHYWNEEKLFIFDDTLLHRSVNESDQIRYCLFVDILRPSRIAPVLSLLVSFFRLTLQGVNAAFYRNWKVVKT